MKYRNWWSVDSFYSHYPRNAVLDWCDVDRPANVNPDFTGNKDITYRFNSRGFRSCELTNVPDKINILISGCSHTLGVGLAVEQTWPHILCSMIENSVLHNVAIGGGSGDYVSRSIFLADQILQADMFFILWPDTSRFEFYSETRCNLSLCVHDATYPQIWLNETHHHNNYLKNLAFIQAVVGERPFYHGTTDLARSPDGSPRARDGIHNSTIWNQRLAEAFYIKYKENDRTGRFSVAEDIMDYKAQHADTKI